jgi:carbonic anhydrase/acetyltransferase-like protein (isoleucine patch superfamily)
VEKAERIRPVIPQAAWIADTARVHGFVTLGEHVSVWFGAVIRAEVEAVTVGDNTNVQDGAVLHVSQGFPCVVGANVTIGHQAIIHGCTIEDGVLIGMGAIVLDGAVIERGAIVAAGTVVPPGMVVPAESLALGLPAKIVGPLGEARQQLAQRGVDNYLHHKEAYRRGIY